MPHFESSPVSPKESALTPEIKVGEKLTASWFHSEKGKARFEKERMLLRSIGMNCEVFMTERRELCLSISRPLGNEFIVVYGERHPITPPRILARRRGEREMEISNIPWMPGSWLVDVLACLIGPDMSVYAEEKAARNEREFEKTTMLEE